MRELLVVDLGQQGYADALTLQRELARARIGGTIDQDLLLLVEHPPVITLGRSSKSDHMLASPDYLRQQGVSVFEVERGGDVTFHGPGQLVGYPIIDLKRHRRDLHWYLRQVEQLLIDAMATYGLACGRRPPYTGVWIDDRKIASIGVHARDWVTWHGFALNVATDLRYFDLIVPCGIQAVRMTSIQAELPNDVPSFAAVAERVVVAAAELFSLTARSVALADLTAATHGSATAAADGGGR
ncbi:MAG TPA: lipoyl(octanoyl) transferase LipB [Gemmatimonadaceae bacterium]|nr:lipoyl(octanoyl) transferase LipB [Gemmatimonadaceae bacterium]